MTRSLPKDPKKQNILKRFHPSWRVKHKEEILEIDSAKIQEMQRSEELEEKYDQIRKRKANRQRKARKKYTEKRIV